MSKWQISNREEVILDDEQEFDYRKIIEKLLSYWRLFFISVAIACVIAFLANRYITPIYVVNASLLIKAEKEIVNPVSDLLYGQEFFGRNNTNLENESSLLQSYSLLEKTLHDLNFNISYFKEGNVRNEELYRKSPIQVNLLQKENAPYGTLFKISRINDSLYNLESVDESTVLDNILDKTGLIPKEYKQITSNNLFFGKPVGLGDFKFSIDNIADSTKKYPSEVLFRMSNYNLLTKSYRKDLSVAPASTESSIINLSMEGPVPQKVKDFINKLIENYIDSELERKNFTAQRTIEFIENQIGFTGDSLRSVEQKLENFKMDKTTVDLSTEGTKLSNALGNLGEQRSRMSMTIKYLEDQRNYLQSNNFDQLIAPSSLGIDDENLNTMVGDLIGLQSEIRIMESDKGLDNPLIRLKRQKMESLRISVLDNIKSLLATNRFRVETLDSQIAGVRGAMSKLPRAERELIDIQRSQSLNEELYVFLMQKKFEAGIAKSSNVPDYRVVNDARIQGVAPVRPSPILNYAMAIFLGLIIPALLVFVLELINNKVNSKSELQKLTRLPLLGQIPSSAKKIKETLVTSISPRSGISEAFRSIRSNLRYMMNGQAGGKTILITSSISGEGKSFCSNNLAFIFSNFGKKVVLINADMRKQYSYQEFGIDDEAGLSDYLAGIAEISQVMYASKYKNLHIITAGVIPPNPSELLINGRFSTLISELRKDFDYIILDTPPVGILSDGLEMMKQSDVNLFIVRQGYTLKEHVEEANELYGSTGKNLAILFNDVKLRRKKYGYGYYDEDQPKNRFNKIFAKKQKVA